MSGRGRGKAVPAPRGPSGSESQGAHRGVRRLTIALVLAAVVAIAAVFAWQRAYMPNNDLLFNRYWWLVMVMPFVGLLLASVTRRHDPEVVGDKVLRHDDPAILEHWTHAFGTVILLVTGIAMGCLFIPNLLSETATNAMMNVHFVGVLLFLFGTTYWLGNAIQSPSRLREHFPDKHVVNYTIRHYGRMIGIKKYTMPPEEKYLESERAAFIMAITVTAAMFVTGVIKTLAHVISLPDALMGPTTFLHDLFALIMVLFIIPHIFFAVFAPGSFPLFISMMTGYLPLKNAQEDHAGWLQQLDKQGRGITADRARRANRAGSAAGALNPSGVQASGARPEARPQREIGSARTEADTL